MDDTSAARRVHDSDHLRRAIAAHLTHDDLARRCVTVSLAWLDTAAQVLYETVTSDFFTLILQAALLRSSPRLYLPHVRLIRTNSHGEDLRDYAIAVQSGFPGVREITGRFATLYLHSRRVHLCRSIEIQGDTVELQSTYALVGQDCWPSDWTRVFQDTVNIVETVNPRADLLPSAYFANRFHRPRRPSDETRVTTMDLRVTGTDLVAVWTKIINLPAFAWLEDSVFEVAGGVSADAAREFLAMRPKHLRQLSLLMPSTEDVHSLRPDDLMAISDLPELVLGAEDDEARSYVYLAVRYDRQSILRFRESCITLSQTEADGETSPSRGENPSRPTAMETFIFTARLVAPVVGRRATRETIALLPEVISGWRMLRNCSNRLLLAFEFEERWIRQIFLHLTQVAPEWAYDDLQMVVSTITEDGWWYPGDVLGWAD